MAEFLLLVAVFAVWFGFTKLKQNLLYRLRSGQNAGERAVSRRVDFHALGSQGHLLKNVTLPFEDGTTQIDHILIDSKGIFVIETKDYEGWLFGDEHARQWTQVLYGQKRKFQNPLHQNHRHVRAIRCWLDFIPPQQIHAVVVFAGEGRFKSGIPPGVLYKSQINAFLRSFPEGVISLEDQQRCLHSLQANRLAVSPETDRKHQAYLAQKHGKRSDWFRF